MSDFKAVAFTNEFNQTINPGEEVIYAGLSYKTTTFRKAKFAGAYFQNVTTYFNKKNEDGTFAKDERGYYIREHKTEYKPVAVKVVGVKDRRYDYKTREYKDVERCAVLPLMRVFKLDTPLTELNDVGF